jgi:hypothetical protein
MSVALRCVGGPRDGNTVNVEPMMLVQNFYLTDDSGPGFYWRTAGLTPLTLTFLPAPGGRFVGPIETIHPRPAVA